MDSIIINGKAFNKYIEADKIAERVKELGNQITEDYEGKSPIFLIVLNGAVIFGSDLVRATELDSEYVCIRAESYGYGMKSSGKIKISGDFPEIENRNVIIVEDIIDTGNTLAELTEYLYKYNPESVEIATLFSKPALRVAKIDVRYIGFEIDPLFVVGYGLDYAHKGRFLKDVYILDEE